MDKLRKELKKLRSNNIFLNFDWYLKNKKKIFGVNHKRLVGGNPNYFINPYEHNLRDYRVFLNTGAVECYNVFVPNNKKYFVVEDHGKLKSLYTLNPDGEKFRELFKKDPNIEKDVTEFLKLKQPGGGVVTNKAIEYGGMYVVYDEYDAGYGGCITPENTGIISNEGLITVWEDSNIGDTESYKEFEDYLSKVLAQNMLDPHCKNIWLGCYRDKGRNKRTGGGIDNYIKTLKFKSKNYNATFNKKNKNKRGKYHKKIKFVKRKRRFTNKLKSKNLNKSYKKFKKKSRNVGGGAIKKIKFKKYKTVKLKSKNFNSTFKKI